MSTSRKSLEYVFHAFVSRPGCLLLLWLPRCSYTTCSFSSNRENLRQMSKDYQQVLLDVRALTCSPCETHSGGLWRREGRFGRVASVQLQLHYSVGLARSKMIYGQTQNMTTSRDPPSSGIHQAPSLLSHSFIDSVHSDPLL